MKVFIKTLGCKVNSYDSNALSNQFQRRGFVVSQDQQDADVTVVNTCSVTSNAEKEARYLTRRYKRDNPGSFLVLTGCYAQTDSATLAELADVDLVFPNEGKHQLVAFVDEIVKGTRSRPASKIPPSLKPVRGNRQAHFKSSLTLFDQAKSDRTRVFLKIQDGCNGFCSYCLIPYARGASISVPMGEILTEVEALVAAGTKEIVFTGIHIGDYGRDLAAFADLPSPFVTLLRQVLAIPGVPRLRISSLEPSEVSPELVALMAEMPERFCDHFHLPLQSGNDRILKLMRRSYNGATYSAAVAMLRSVFPDANIGADIIPGFPTETAEEFADTVAFIKTCDLNYLHVFPYSKRPNTSAARLDGHLPPAEIVARASALRALSQQLTQAYSRRFIGQSLTVLWEQDRDAQGRQKGHAANYLQVVCGTAAGPRPGDISAAQLMGLVDTNTLLGVLA